MPLITVIIPTYNRAHLIGRAIQSVLNQTYKDFEIIVVDDGSSDNTKQAVKSFNDKRIKYLRLKENSGSSAAPGNTAIKIASGKYVAFLDSDDEWLPESLEKKLKCFEGNIGVVYSGFIRRNDEKKMEYTIIPTKRGNIYRDELRKDYVSSTSAVMVRRECFDKVGLFDETLPARQDYDMWLRLSKHYLFNYVPDPLVIIHIGRQDTIDRNILAQKEGERRIREKISKEIQGLSSITQRRILAYHYYRAGNRFCWKFGVRYCREELLQAIKLWPFNLLYWLSFFASYLMKDKWIKSLTAMKSLIQVKKWFDRF